MVIFGFIAAVTLLFVVKFIGKRGAYLISLAGLAVCFVTIGTYGFCCLPKGQGSLKHVKLTYRPEAYVPLIAFFGLHFFASFGIWNVVWLMMSEVFPTK